MADKKLEVYFDRQGGTIKACNWSNGLTIKRMLEKLGYTAQEVASFENGVANFSMREQGLGELGIETVLNAGDFVVYMSSVKGA